ncbi:hypothetical protein IV38_GL001922 [Lactobacillus selangorensis]|uniref:Teichoic acid polysaccharide export protein n=1 Tax=Lactobacillus selangorensis TaxID=81857 RepID=A0A0R2FSH7_9LACO|nr:DUF6056 family protein [Lactobacillus selangorensis]KRN27709.1 hypothetical protein IV38_GL001922 [Lactobacillus selangorensis]KRN30326.1 hypothetical protein IV40_GL001915 [Lactobacillus selangorensis]
MTTRSRSAQQGGKGSLKWLVWLFLALSFAFFAYLSATLPITGDDFGWASGFGANYFKSGRWLTYDGRYLGDWLIITMMRVRWFKIVVYAAGFTGILYLISLFFPKRRLFYTVGSFVLLMGMPVTLFAQTFGWNAGFVNYVPSVLVPLGMLYLFRKYLYYQSVPLRKRTDYWLTAFILPLAILGQFFAEHITLFNVVLSIAALGYFWYFQKQKARFLWGYAAGSVIGALLMFSDGAYHSVAKNADQYRHVKLSLDTVLATIRNTLFTNLASKNLLILLVVSVVALFLIVRADWKLSHKVLLGVSLWLEPLYQIFLRTTGISHTHLILNVNMGLTLLYFVALLVFLWRCLPHKQAAELTSYLVMAILLVAPFAVASPVGPRCFFASYILLILFTLLLISETVGEQLSSQGTLWLTVLLMAAALGQAVPLMRDAHDMQQARQLQVAYLYFQTQDKQKSYAKVTLQYLEVPHRHLIWQVASQSNDWEYNEYYLIPGHAGGTVIPYSQWHKIYLKEPNTEQFFQRMYWGQ